MAGGQIVLYGIDMGSPTKKGGFFAWRWEQCDSLTSHSHNDGWEDSPQPAYSLGMSWVSSRSKHPKADF